MITRKQYMDNSSADNFDWFAAYYSQFVNEQVKKAVLNKFGSVEKLATCFAKDKHLNNLPLHLWDQLIGYDGSGNFNSRNNPFYAILDRGLLKEAGEGWSASTGICIAKQAARMMVEEFNKGNVEAR